MGVLRRFLQVVLLLATLLVGAAAVIIIVSQTAWFRDWLRGVIVRQANQYLNGSLSIGRLGGNLFFGLEFQDLGVTSGGERVIAVKNAGIDYSVIQFISGDIVIDHIRLDRPVVLMKKEAGGWNLGQLVKKQKQEKQRTGPGKPISIGEVGISDGTFIIDRGPVGTSGTGEAGNGTPAGASGNAAAGGLALPREIQKIDARFSFKYEPVHYTLDIGHISLRGRDPDIALNDLSGRIGERDANLYLDKLAVRTAESSLKVDGVVGRYATNASLSINATSDKLSIPEIARLVPALRGILLQPAFRVSAKGPLNALALDFAVNSKAGNASGQVTADLLGREHGIKGEVHLKDLDLQPIVKSPAAKSNLTGLARLDVRFPAAAAQGPVAGSFSVSTFSARLGGYAANEIEARGRIAGKVVTIEQSKALAYGAAATAAGTVEPGVRGPRGTSVVAMDLHGSVAGLDLRRLPRQLKIPTLDSRLNLDYRVSGVGAEIKADARLRPSTVAGAQLADQTTASVSTVGATIHYAAEGNIAGLDVERFGRGLNIAALSTDRFKSDLNGRFSARGSGTVLPSLTLDATAALHTSTLDAISLPLMNVEAHLANGGGRFRVDGGFSNLDPSRFTGKAETKGNVAGRVNVDATMASLSGPMTPDSIAAKGEVVLGRSNVGGLEIDKARVAGEYANSGGQIQEATITGPDLGLRASGPLSLGSSGSSNLAYHLETPSLQAIGKVIGQQMQGFVSLDGRVTGNRTNLSAQGDLRGGNLRVGGAEILTAQSHYDVTVPDLETARLQAKADSTLGFLKVGGQDVNVLRATTTYGNSRVGFDATAEQSVRSGRVVGTLLLHPDHQEVHLTQFGIKTQGVSWSLAPGTEPTVQYGGGDIGVKDVHLVSGDQSLVVEGTIGKERSNLRAALNDVNLAHLDTWIVGERRLGGMLNAAAAVTGSSSALNVNGDFSIDGGAFREFRYQTLGGHVTYAQDRIALDVRLQQGPQAWLTARGSIPTALFSAPTTTSGAPAPGSDAPVDLAVKSSPIDLGLVQGFTDAITKATGTLQADVRLAGTAAAPVMSGGLSVTNGAFTVAPAGVSYKALNGRVDLQPGRAVIDQMGVTDEHGRTMALSGEVGVQGRNLGAVKLKVTSRKFEILHNDIGRVTVNTDLNVAGDIRAPQVQGKIGVNTATINIDRVLDLATASAYSTKPESATAASGAPDAPGTPPVGTAGRGQTNPVGAPQAAAPTAAAPNAGAGGGGTQPAAASGAVPPARRRAASGQLANAAPGSAAPPSSGGLFDAAALNLTLTVPDDLVLNGKDIQPGNTPIGVGNVNITLGGNLTVTKAAARPIRFVGVVNTVRGTYDFQGRRFDIQRDGRVRFDGFVPVNPALDITATRLISGVEARVHVGGTMLKPELTLTSNPPLDQADILSLIIFNQPANELGEGQQVSLAQRASALATGFVASKLADSIGKALNLDVFEIQTEATPTGGQGATVTLGEQVGRNLYFKVVQGVGADNVSQFVLDYNLTNWLRFETTMTQGGTANATILRRVQQSGADLIFFFSY